jgi:AraC-like DNA-binding protein
MSAEPGFDFATLGRLLHAAQMALTAAPTAALPIAQTTAIARARRLVVQAVTLVDIQVNDFGQLPSSCAQRAGLEDWQVARVRQFIDAHLGETIRVKDLSGMARLSSNHFNRMFKRTFSQSPHAYVMRQRAIRAAELMLHEEMTLSEVAQLCGFADQAHFSRVFRRNFGQSPFAWRRRRAIPYAVTDAA